MAGKPRKKTTKSTSLVPVLFTLGVIGWGFFAIDRLTSTAVPDYMLNPVEAHDVKSDNKAKGISWRKSAENFLSHFKKDNNDLVKDYQDFDSWQAVATDDQPAETAPEPEPISSVYNYSLYFYKETSSGLELTKVNFSDKHPVTHAQLFNRLINGPVKNNNYLDSFPVKPTVIETQKQNDTLVLNLDDNFGHGISFETAELQVKQFLKTAAQFKDVKYLKFLINSREIENISVDGLMIPSKFRIN